jgi:hypothetical protein
MPRLDLSKPQEGTGGNYNLTDKDEGVYDATVVSAEHGKTDEGKERLIVDFETTDGSRYRKWLYMHTKDTKRITLDQISRLGVPPNWSPKNTDELVGKKCRIEVGRDNTGAYASVEKILQQYIEPGKYTCSVSKVGEKEEAKSGKEFRRVFFKIHTAGPYQNLQVMDRLYFNEKSLSFTGAKLQSMGAKRADFDTDNDRHMQELVGNNVELTLTIRKGSDGKEYLNVKNVKLLEGGAAPASPGPAVVEDVVDIPDDDVAGYDEEPF